MGQGNGYMLIGDSEFTMQDVGALEGNTVAVTTREVLQAFDGQPQLLVKEEVLKEMARVSCTLKEKTLEMLARQQGYNIATGIDTTLITEATVSSVTERKYLYDPDSWAHLKYKNILKSPAPVVMSNAPTPAALDFGDIDTPGDDGVIYKGSIRRVEGGDVSYGDYIDITYSAVRGSTQGVHLGGLNTKEYFRAEFVYEMSQDSHYPECGGRQITTLPRCYTAPETQEQYNAGNWNVRELALDAIGDLTLAEGQRLMIRRHEMIMEGVLATY